MTEDKFRLSPGQRQWLASGRAAGPGHRARYQLPSATTLTDVRRVLDELSDRHEALRLRFTVGRHEPFQQVPDEHRPPVGTAEPAADEDWLRHPVTAVFTPGRLTVLASPLALDPESLRLLGAELRDRLGADRPDDDEDDEDRLQFIDISEWELEQLPAAAPDTRAPVVLPSDGPAGSAEAFLDPVLVDRLQQRAADDKTTTDDLVLAAWIRVLSRYAADADTTLIFGRYHAGRSLEGTRGVLGSLGRYEAVTMTEPAGIEVASPLAEPAQLVATFAGSVTGDDEIEVDGPASLGALHLECVTGAGTMTLRVRADAGEYAPWLRDSVVGTLIALLDDVPGVPSLGAAEAAALAELGHGPTQTRPSSTTIQDLLEQGVRGSDPARPAVIDGDTSLTFGELDASASDLAGELAARGVAPGDRVTVLVDRGWRTVVAFLAVMRAGAVYVPVDPDQPAARIAALVARVGAVAVIGDESFPVTRVSEPSRPRHLVDRAPTDPAYIIFTSGSTGAPRPVLVNSGAVARLHRALAATVYAATDGQLRVSVNAPATFDASVKQLIQLASGHTLCPVPAGVREDPPGMLRFLAEHRIDVLDCTPSHVRLLLEARQPGDALPGLLLIGGEAIDEALWAELAGLDGVRAINLYGPTECTVDSTFATVRAGTSPTIGRPLPGVGFIVADAAGRPLPVGAPGELLITGGQLADGYFGDEAATAARFITVADSGGTPVRAYRTGDRVRLRPDGRLDYLGRTDDQIKIRGTRIEPGEITAALRKHPSVRTAAVITHGDGGRRRLVAYAVPAARAVDPHRLAGINPHETQYLYDEIFTQETYLRGGVTLPAGAVVFDVGANIGMFSLFVASLVADARLYAFEPVTPVFDALRVNLAPLEGNARLFAHGLSGTERDTTFAYYPGYSMMSGEHAYADPQAEKRVVRRYLTNARNQSGRTADDELLSNLDDLLADRFDPAEQRCRLRRLSQVIDEEGVDRIDLLKIDVQRAELDVLLGLDERHWPLIQQIAMEVHEDPDGPTAGRGRQIAEMLEKHGFTVLLEQDELLVGTDRFNLHAFRPAYRSATAPAPAPAAAASGPELRDWLAEQLPAYLVPDSIEIIDRLPLTRNGKLDRAALPDPDTGSATDYAPPTHPAEQILIEIWQETLGIARLGVDDNVFQVGADSIRAIRARAAAARRGLVFPLRDIFRYQTVRELVRESVRERPAQPVAENPAFALLTGEDRKLVPAGVVDAYPMTALQQGMVYHSALIPERHSYHVVTGHRVAAPFDAAALRVAVDGLAAAHPAIRTVFDLATFSEPMQLVRESVTVETADEDISDLAPDQREQRAAAAFDEERSRPFDVTADVPLRFRAVRLSGDEFELIVAHHHAAMDGWSLHLMLAELLRRYAAARTGATPPVAGPALSPRRLVELERQTRQEPSAVQAWRALLAGVSGVAPVGSRPPHMTAQLNRRVDAGLTADLRAFAARHEVPLKAVLLAAHARALGAEGGSSEVVTGLVVGQRPGEESADLALGLFITTLPVRLPVAGVTPAELAAEAWRSERDLMGRHLVPLADIEAATGGGRLFDVFFNFTDFSSVRTGTEDGSRVVATREATVDVAFALAVDVSIDTEPGLNLTLQFDAEIWPPDRAAGFAERYHETLARFAAEPETRLPETAVAAFPTPAEPEPDVEHATALAIDQVLARVWAEVLGREPRGDVSFFDDGGDSLLALRLTTRLSQRLGAPISLADFVRDSRPARLSALIEERLTSDPESYSVTADGDRVLMVETEAGWTLPPHARHEAGCVVSDLQERHGLPVVVEARAWELGDWATPYGYLAAPAGDGPAPDPAGARWIPAAELGALPLAVPVHRRALDDWSASRQPGGPELRSGQWGKPQWRAEMAEWLHQVATGAGRRPTGPVEQFIVSPYSYTARMATDGGTIWFKAAPAPFRHEPALVDLLHRTFPGRVPRVLAIDAARGFLATEDIGAYREIGSELTELDLYSTVASAYAGMQRDLTDTGADVLALGVPDRRLGVLPELLARLAEDNRVLSPDDPSALTPDERRRLVACVPWFADRCAQLAEFGLPDVVQNTDFWRDCIAVTDSGFVLFDWAESVYGNPLSSLTTVRRDYALEGRADRAEIEARLIEAYLTGWGGDDAVRRLTAAVDLAKPTGFLMRALSWRACMDGMTDLDRYPGTRGVVARNMRELLALVDA
ncbi:methyltransferase, FkbM family/amino acid adenylation domain-containing protein [Micromonospora pattaloongensis]|uniref:Methyltransferase, FkbM family/amino acid adenylation domain-containing protein n=1 Tax=Micromonospora pattaloongensis TaxID=405436 RepID=A0A1H3JWP1_9ACTN|nr:non-ribosomal peptide synthetase [Micromonospora pattaloongensis]SDY43768.1 methyltransferase, FkbM family/amino acid adenylation domain-containing protein [Micromonospora pattaloongensis]